MKKIKFIIFTALVLCALVLLVLLVARSAQKIENATRGGLQLHSQIWSGTIKITDDITFAPWATLTIQPGAKILFEKNSDASNALTQNTPWTKWADDFIISRNDPTGHTGYNATHFEIYAKIIARGTAGAPIIFTSAQAKPEYADWDELVLGAGSVLDHVDVSFAHNGINVQGDNVSITNSRAHDSLWSCIDIFSFHNRVENNEVFHCWHQALGLKAGDKIAGQDNLILNNFFHDAQLSINCEQGAKPTIQNNKFEAAPVSPDCGVGGGGAGMGSGNLTGGNTQKDRPPDSAGGTYNGKLIYPAQ